MIVVGYYTPGPYAVEAQRLIDSLERVGLRYDIREVPDLGSWQRNTQRKAAFLREMVDVYAGHELLYLDADAVVHRSPLALEGLDADIAVHWRDGHELLSGTIWFHANAAVAALFDEWGRVNAEQPEAWDQRTLDEAIKRHRDRLKVYHLPPCYCQITDLMAHHGEPCIEHLQASRQHGPSKSSLLPGRMKRLAELEGAARVDAV